MKASLLTPYKNGFKLFKEEGVRFENEKDGVFYFEVNGHQVTLSFKQIPNSKQYERHWSCDCTHFSLFSNNPFVVCKHLMAVEYWLGSK